MPDLPALPATPAAADAPSTRQFPVGHRLFLVLATVALIYALLAGLRTVSDLDVGWQLATGRWVAQHHHVSSTDVFSYTAQGEPWIYPVGAGLLLYAAYSLGGYALISWMGAAACLGSVALLLRRGSAVGAGIAILAIPLIAQRTAPRADLFTVVLFAAFLSLLWENYQTGRAPLWLLPVLMLAWVNLHFGFVAGLALLLAYAGVEFSETFLGEARRRNAWRRLRHASGWLVGTAAITLANPWGWGIYRALLRQERAAGQQQLWIMEWTSVPLNWTAASGAFSLWQTKGAIYLLLVIALVAAALALLRARLGAAALLLAATYPPLHHVRMGAVFACVVVVIAGPILTEAIAGYGSRIRRGRIRLGVAAAAAVLLVALASLRSFDLVTNRHYFRGVDIATFGTGLSWWFPQRAAEFIERENLPGEIFNTYDEGGFLVWRLGPHRRVYIDGRDTLYGISRMQRHGELLETSPDSDLWQQEADRYNINTIILPLARFDGVQLVKIADFCSSRRWRPVYLDEISAVFVRRQPETEAVIQRSQVDCATASLPALPLADSPAGSFNQWANAASLLAALGRPSEALSATEQALALFPDSGFVRWLRGSLLEGAQRRSEAEEQYLTAVSLDRSEATWSGLAGFYQRTGQVPEAVRASQQAIQLSSRPDLALVQLAHYYFQVRQPRAALQALDEALRVAPVEALADTKGRSLRFDVAQGRAAAWGALGDFNRATSFEEEAVRLDPDAADAWSHLAKLYQRQARFEDQVRAEQHAAALAASQSH
jgi:tetratricopeptide (TPR) repeat protein